MEEAKATYQYLEESHGNGMFFYTSCCGNRMYSVESDPMKYHGCLCPKCFQKNKFVTLYLRGTPDGIRVFETEHVVRAGSEKQGVILRHVMSAYGVVSMDQGGSDIYASRNSC